MPASPARNWIYLFFFLSSGNNGVGVFILKSYLLLFHRDTTTAAADVSVSGRSGFSVFRAKRRGKLRPCIFRSQKYIILVKSARAMCFSNRSQKKTRVFFFFFLLSFVYRHVENCNRSLQLRSITRTVKHNRFSPPRYRIVIGFKTPVGNKKHRQSCSTPRHKTRTARLARRSPERFGM